MPCRLHFVDRDFLKGLSIIFQALILSRLSYAILASGGFVQKALASRIDTFLRRSIRFGVFDHPLTL